MDDMSPFEHQIARLVQQTTRPARAVDTMSIVRTIPAHAAGSRFRSMFSAAKFVVAGAIVALFGGFLLAGVMMQSSDQRVPDAGASASAGPMASPVWTRILPAFSGWNAKATDDALWVPDPRDGLVIRIDARSGELAEWGAPTDAFLVPTDDAVWAVGEDGVIRIDRASHELSGLPDRAGGPTVVADGSIWVWSQEPGRSSLVEIDLESAAVRNEYAVDDSGISGSGEDGWVNATFGDRWIGATDDAIWLRGPTGDGSGSTWEAGPLLTRFDLETRAFSDPIQIEDASGPGMECCIAVDGAIWMKGPAGTLLRFDAATLRVTDTLDLGPEPMPGIGVELGPAIVADGAIWIGEFRYDESGEVPTLPSRVHRVDLSTNEATAIGVDAWGRRGLAFGEGAVWVGGPPEEPGSGHGRLWRIDIDSLEVTEVGSCPDCKPFSPLLSNGVIWINTDFGAVLRVDGVIDAE